MIFEKDGTTVTLDSPAQYPLKNSTTIVQAKDKSASGITHVESFEIKSTLFTFNFVDLSEEDFIKIHEWFLNTVDGMLEEFNLTDDLGITRLVRFDSPTLPFSLNSFGNWSGSFTVEEII